MQSRNARVKKTESGNLRTSNHPYSIFKPPELRNKFEKAASCWEQAPSPDNQDRADGHFRECIDHFAHSLTQRSHHLYGPRSIMEKPADTCTCLIAGGQGCRSGETFQRKLTKAVFHHTYHQESTGCCECSPCGRRRVLWEGRTQCAWKSRYWWKRRGRKALVAIQTHFGTLRWYILLAHLWQL